MSVSTSPTNSACESPVTNRLTSCWRVGWKTVCWRCLRLLARRIAVEPLSSSALAGLALLAERHVEPLARQVQPHRSGDVVDRPARPTARCRAWYRASCSRPARTIAAELNSAAIRERDHHHSEHPAGGHRERSRRPDYTSELEVDEGGHAVWPTAASAATRISADARRPGPTTGRADEPASARSSSRGHACSGDRRDDEEHHRSVTSGDGPPAPMLAEHRRTRWPRSGARKKTQAEADDVERDEPARARPGTVDAGRSARAHQRSIASAPPWMPPQITNVQPRRATGRRAAS